MPQSIPLNHLVSLRKLAEVLVNNPANEVLLESDYHISKRKLRDMLSHLLVDLREDDEIVLTETYQKGSLYLGNVCRIFHDNYIPLWYCKLSKV